MYLLAQHLQWKFKKNITLIVPSKTDSRILPVKKYKQFKADWHKRRYGITKLPALVLSGRVLCEGELRAGAEDEIKIKVERIIKELNHDN